MRIHSPWVTFVLVGLVTLSAGSCSSGEATLPDQQPLAGSGGGTDASAGNAGHAGYQAGGASGTANGGQGGSAANAGQAGTAGIAGAGQAGDAGTSGSAGQSGNAGTSGFAGEAGSSGQAGNAGEAGSSGQAGNAGGGGAAGNAGAGGVAGGAGTGGAAGKAGSAGGGGSAGKAGTGGAAGKAGSAGTAGGGTGGTAAQGGSAGTGGTQDAGPGNPCTTDSDCSAGLTCQIVPNSSSTALELRCSPLVGANGTGYTCTDNSQCRSGLCLGGHCSTPCTNSSQCTQAGSCEQRSVTIGGLTANFQLCVVEPCTSTKDCDPGEVCSDLQWSTNLVEAYCRQSQAGGSPVGTNCANSSTCTTLLCPSWLQICTEVCSSDADCTAIPSGICTDLSSAGTSLVQACAQGCSRVSDCPTGKTCRIGTDTKGDQHRFECGPPGSAPTGSDCSTVNNCSSGLCLTNYSGGVIIDEICTQPCVTGADCPTGYGVCANVQMTTPSGNGTQIISVCNHP